MKFRQDARTIRRTIVDRAALLAMLASTVLTVSVLFIILAYVAYQGVILSHLEFHHLAADPSRRRRRRHRKCTGG